MPRNVEIKARLHELATIRQLVEDLADQGPEELEQVDTYFHCTGGRLKLRELGDGGAELIFYRRADVAGPRESLFFVTPTGDPNGLEEILSAANGVLGIVKKKRLLFLIGQTRVHLDQVEGLGTFVELEVVLRREQSADDGRAIAQRLMQRLAIIEDQLVESSYIDLLLSASADR